jgi:hypothetical protein
MTGKKIVWAAVVGLLAGNAGCCRWHDRWCGTQTYAPAAQCAPACQPAYCAPAAPPCQPVSYSPVPAAVPGGPTTWQRCP